MHRHTRRNLWLTSPPGSIAAIVSLTSRSGFGELLVPYDDVKSMKEKLSGLRFRLDRRTGAILADDNGTGDLSMGPDDSMMSLLGGEHRRIHSSASVPHPSDPPWEYTKTPFEP